eukprot:1402235-Amphidinium_carterae.1
MQKQQARKGSTHACELKLIRLGCIMVFVPDCTKEFLDFSLKVDKKSTIPPTLCTEASCNTGSPISAWTASAGTATSNDMQNDGSFAGPFCFRTSGAGAPR